MSLPIHVGAHSGYKVNERPRDFTFAEELYEIAEIEDRWYETGGDVLQSSYDGRQAVHPTLRRIGTHLARKANDFGFQLVPSTSN